MRATCESNCSEEWSCESLKVVLLLSAAAVLVLAGSVTAADSGDNNKCYVCHPYLKTEKLTTVHEPMGITCDVCHGPSIEHMHDEMLMTAPDKLFGRAEVRSFCSGDYCHAPADDREYYTFHDHEDTKKVMAFSKKWHGKMRPNGRAVSDDSVCTDCHGTHNLDKPVGNAAEQEDMAEWIALFNGEDLTGWKGQGGAKWTMKYGRIVGTLDSGVKSGVLWSVAEFKDYEMAVTFKAEFPIHAGIYSRGMPAGKNESKDKATGPAVPQDAESGSGQPSSPKFGPRVEIFDSRHPGAHSGSIFLPGKGLAVLNFDDNLIDKEAWNTIAMKVQGRKVAVWLNAEKIGEIAADGPQKGKIGFYLGRDENGSAGEFTIREVLLKPIEKKVQ